jgi:hypothetical protein
MTDQTEEQRLAAHRAKLQAAGAVSMTPEEILAGQTQAGVPRPAFLSDHEDDGSVERVGLAETEPDT